MRGSSLVVYVIVGAIAWISFTVGGMAAVVIFSFFTGCIVTIGVMSMTGGLAATNAKALASREKLLDQREKLLIVREAKADQEVKQRSKQLATEQYLSWKRLFLAEQQQKQQQEQQQQASIPLAAPARPVMQWTEADL